ncbi:uncharacterized protein [Physcomitrium patens]|uniref:uncharacterized protein isoform X1 n=1 Tax=Physcomitrium patens TaxID=3218 RepID=UPI003CCD97BE
MDAVQPVQYQFDEAFFSWIYAPCIKQLRKRTFLKWNNLSSETINFSTMQSEGIQQKHARIAPITFLRELIGCRMRVEQKMKIIESLSMKMSPSDATNKWTDTDPPRWNLKLSFCVRVGSLFLFLKRISIAGLCLSMLLMWEDCLCTRQMGTKLEEQLVMNRGI